MSPLRSLLMSRTRPLAEKTSSDRPPMSYTAAVCPPTAMAGVVSFTFSLQTMLPSLPSTETFVVEAMIKWSPSSAKTLLWSLLKE